MSGPIEPGARLPALGFVDADGQPRALSDFAGAPLVLYFYPKADTPGCTNEAKDFTALAADFAAAGATVIGLSRDTPAKLAKFRDKYGLSVLLGSDGDGQLTEGFGVWIEKSMYGRSYMGIERATFLFDSDAVLARVWHGVKVKGHADEVLAAVRALG
jgi:peroxiredoxin Q/BCP